MSERERVDTPQTHLILLHAPRDGLLEADGLEGFPVHQRLEPAYVLVNYVSGTFS